MTDVRAWCPQPDVPATQLLGSDNVCYAEFAPNVRECVRASGVTDLKETQL